MYTIEFYDSVSACILETAFSSISKQCRNIFFSKLYLVCFVKYTQMYLGCNASKWSHINKQIWQWGRNASMCGENCIYLKQKKAKHARQDTWNLCQTHLKGNCWWFESDKQWDWILCIFVFKNSFAFWNV